jgi:hypothetical protein
MGFANAQRMLDYIRIIVEFISQPEYKDLVPMFGIVDEDVLVFAYRLVADAGLIAYLPGIGRDALTSVCVPFFPWLPRR